MSPAVGPERVAVSGPNLAREIAVRQPTATVVACEDEAAAELVSRTCCQRPTSAPTRTRDVVGVRAGGAVKNVIALAVGIAEGMGLGDNTKATIITRGLAETARLGVRSVPTRHLAGLAGLGDLVATCVSPLSRNRTLGEALGQGMTLDEALPRQHTARGRASPAASILELARRHGVEMPITEQSSSSCTAGPACTRWAARPLGRPRKPEGA